MSQDTAGLATELRALYPAFEGLDAARFAALLEHAQLLEVPAGTRITCARPRTAPRAASSRSASAGYNERSSVASPSDAGFN